MNQAPRCTEAERLAALYKYHILDTRPEAAFDELTELAALLFDAPIAVINFIDQERQWFKSEKGLGVRETPLETSFCAHALLQEDMMVIPDTREDDRFACNPLVTDGPQFRFYAGALVKSDDGHPIGTLCILDVKPRDFDASQQQILRVLANQVMAQLEQRRLVRESEASIKELAALNKRLVEQDRSKDKFLAMVAHELRNPLTPIMMRLDLLQLRDPSNKAISDDIAVMQRQVKHLSRLVDDLFDASRVASGKISLELKKLPLPDVVRRSVEVVQEAANEKHQQLTVRLPDDDLCLLADEIRISQVFINLLNNAIRYTPPQGKIVLEAQLVNETQVEVTVADNGIGISQDYLERIFESFVQVPNGTENPGGLGIGLHLCRQIVHMHHGEISATSPGLNRGSRFTVALPLVSTDAGCQTDSTQRAEKHNSPN